MNSDSTIRTIAQQLCQAERALFVTGAGVSVDSGLPTYRGIDGLYEGKSTADGMPIEEALSGTMLAARPEVTWKYLWEIAEVCRGARPNRCHEILAAFGERIAETFILTQNVDGLHRQAGSRDVIEIHGRASDLHCTRCAFRGEGESYLFGGGFTAPAVPTCPECGAVVRPAVVLFGETLPVAAVEALQGLAETGVDLVMSVGTSSLFPYITAPMELAYAAGIPTVEINLEETAATPFATHVLRMSCGDALHAIAKEVDRLDGLN